MSDLLYFHNYQPVNVIFIFNVYRFSSSIFVKIKELKKLLKETVKETNHGIFVQDDRC